MPKKKAPPTVTIQGVVSEEDRAILELLAFQSGKTTSAFIAQLLKDEITRQKVKAEDVQSALRRYRLKQAKKGGPTPPGEEGKAA